MKCPWCIWTICYIGQFFRDRLAEFSDTLGIHKSIGQQCVGRITSEWYSNLIEALLRVQAQKQTAFHKKSVMQWHPTVHMKLMQRAVSNIYGYILETWYMVEGAPTSLLLLCQSFPTLLRQAGFADKQFETYRKSSSYWCDPPMKSDIPNVLGNKNWFETMGFPASDLPVPMSFC